MPGLLVVTNPLRLFCRENSNTRDRRVFENGDFMGQNFDNSGRIFFILVQFDNSASDA